MRIYKYQYLIESFKKFYYLNSKNYFHIFKIQVKVEQYNIEESQNRKRGKTFIKRYCLLRSFK